MDGLTTVVKFLGCGTFLSLSPFFRKTRAPIQSSTKSTARMTQSWRTQKKSGLATGATVVDAFAVIVVVDLEE
jgi:hypothetical protein